MVSQKPPSDPDDCAIQSLVSLCSSSDNIALLLYKILGRIVKNEVRIEKLERELERLKND